MAKKVPSLAARVAALEKAVAGFFAGKTGVKKRKKAGAAKTKKAKAAGRAARTPRKPAAKSARETRRVRPPPAQLLLPTGDPVFVTPLDQL